MGYAGGTRENPTYHALGDHTECFQVDFDPSVSTYGDLLQLVWQSHDPTREGYKVQYASLVLAHDEQQLAEARESAAALQAAIGRRVTTRIEPLTRFWIAEDYHQKYYLRNDRDVMPDFAAVYADERAFTDSTAAARANGYLAGAGRCADLERELPLLGLSTRAGERMRSRCRT